MTVLKLLKIFLGTFIVTLIFTGCDFFASKKVSSVSKQNRFSLLGVESFLDPKPEESRLQSKALILNFWASWCEPCRQETPELLKIARNHKEKINLLMVSGDGSAKEMKKFMSLFPNFKAENIFVAQDISRDWILKYGVSGFPETFIYDQNHKLISKFEGALDFESLEFKKALEKIITKQTD